MKSFKQFNEDAYAGRQGAGAWFASKALELGARGIRQGYKGIKALTSLASGNDQEKLTKRQLLDKVRNLRRDQKIKEVIKNTEKGSPERAKGLSGIPKAKVLEAPPKYTGN